MKSETLYTQRLMLREIDDGDAPIIVEWRSSPEVYRFFVSPHSITLDEHNKWYNNRYLSDLNRIDFMAIDKSDESKIGVFGIKRSENSDNAEISYLLSDSAKGKGFATEAVNCLMDFAKNNWNCGEVFAEIHKDNFKSVALVKRLGFELEHSDGEFVIYKRLV